MIDAGRASCVLIVHDTRRILTVRRKDGSGWALPGGKGEQGETAKITACRELDEETGAVTLPGRLVLLHVGPSAISGRLVHLYYAHKITGEPHTKEPGVDVRWMDFDSLLGMSPYEKLYRQAFPDGIEHLRPTEILVL